MIKIMAGTNFNNNILDAINNLNNNHINRNKIKITELYGSLQSDFNPLGTARPDYRLQKVNFDEFILFVQRAKNINVDINYTINNPYIGNIEHWIETKMDMSIIYLKELEKIGVSKVTVTHPFLMKVVSENCNIPIEVSTIQHARTLGQIKYYSKNFNVKKICLDLYRNRDIQFLKDAAKIAYKNNVELELMINEFCSVNGIPCSGLYRNSCYLVHGTGGNKNKVGNNYPMSNCIMYKKENQSNWLKSRFILPQWLEYYQSLGISNFKLTGRTFPVEQQLWLMEQYMNLNYEGKLSKLWRRLPDAEEITDDIDCALLNKVDFLNKWKQNKNFRCEDNCEFSCFYCDNVLSDTPSRTSFC